MKLNFLLEGEFDSPEILSWKIQQAQDLARKMEGWDIVVAQAKQNRFFDLGNHASVAARFFEQDIAREWALKTEADRKTIRRWNDERFQMPCFIAKVEFDYPEE
jgi:hypothetical protein